MWAGRRAWDMDAAVCSTDESAEEVQRNEGGRSSRETKVREAAIGLQISRAAPKPQVEMERAVNGQEAGKSVAGRCGLLE